MSGADQDFGIQDDGSFNRKTLDHIRDSLVTIAKSELGNVDLDRGSPPRQLIDVAAIEIADLWESLEGVYYGNYFEDSVGIQIDRILSLAGVSRIPRRGATGEVTFTATSVPTDDISIEAGTVVTTNGTEQLPPIPFQTTAQSTIEAGAQRVQNVPIRALEPWEANISEEYLGENTNVAADTITNLRDDVAGVSVTNPVATGSNDFVSGRDRETDPELRRRYRDSLALGGQASVQAIRAHVLNEPDVTAASVEENVTTTDNTGSGGLPPKSFRVTVVGGGNQDIAHAITTTRAAGIESYGSVTATATLDDGSTYDESFDRATEKQIYVDVTVDTEDTFPSDGVEQIENNLIRYIGGQTSGGTNIRGTDIGEDVMFDLVFAASMEPDGVFGADITLGTASSPTGTSDIPISNMETARTSQSNITVTVNSGSIP